MTPAIAAVLAVIDILLVRSDDIANLIETLTGEPLTPEQRSALHQRHDAAISRRRAHAASLGLTNPFPQA